MDRASARRILGAHRLRWLLVVAAVFWSVNAFACFVHDLNGVSGTGSSVVHTSPEIPSDSDSAGTPHALICPHLAGAHLIPALGAARLPTLVAPRDHWFAPDLAWPPLFGAAPPLTPPPIAA
jgi:hypothetical protein